MDAVESAQPLRRRAIAALKRHLARTCRAVGFACASVAWAAHGANLDAGARAQLDRIVAAQIAAGRVPGAVLAFGDAHHVFYRQAFGQRVQVPGNEAMTVDTVFDLASLTKVIATTTAVMQLVERGQLDLDSPVARYWPAFAANGKQAVTVRQLLTHQSGLPPDLPLGPDAATRDGVLREVVAQRLRAQPGERAIYSDINFVVLGELVQQITHRTLAAYCRDRIFAPLRMHDTMFLPDAARAARSAATTADRNGMRRGRVHDPTAARMGGVAGNAGLFSTADDLARFAQMLLDDGRAGAARILQPQSVAALATPATPLSPPPWRSLGWVSSGPLAANRDRLVPVGAVEHTGYTGTAIWIDFVSRQFAVILTNRVHPDDRDDARPLRAQAIALLASQSPPQSAAGQALALPSAAPALAAATRPPNGAGPVDTGIDVLEALRFAPLAGLRVGLITNRTGFDRAGARTIDLLAHAPDVELAALFAPEHGLGADQDARVVDARDGPTGLPVYSLYGTRRRIPDAALEGLDALVFDLQDAGVRFFTYETTLGYALEAAAAHRIPLFVLDRPDPLGADRVGGPTLDRGRESFTGYFPLPLLPGMTVGELAALFDRERGIGADLRVIPLRGYRRSMRFADTGLGWTPLSPNLRTAAQLDLYPDVALLEGANVSVGRGSPHPFEWVGAPWLDSARVAAMLNALDLGVQAEPVDFVPTESTYRGVLCHGVSLHAGREPRRPARLGLALLSVLHALYPATFDLDATRDSIGDAQVWQAIRAGDGLDAIEAVAERRSASFSALRSRYLRY